MFEKEAEEKYCKNCKLRQEQCLWAWRQINGLDMPNEENCSCKEVPAYIAGAEFGYNKANEWHYVKDGDLPKENQECYFIYSNTYEKLNKVSFAKSNIKVRTGIYSFFLDDEGNQTTDPCFYDDVIGDEIDLSEVYAWKEIVLPKEIKEK